MSSLTWPYLERTVSERDTRYGGFKEVAKLSQELQSIIFSGNRKLGMSPHQIESVQVICSKLARAVCGDPDYPDNWVDIAGYATLVAKYLSEKDMENEQ